MQAQLLAPAAVLIAWSLIMLLWMAASRFPAMKRANIGFGAKPGARGQDLEGLVEDQAQWKSHNYAHLMEQPTIFYAAIVIIALMGGNETDTLFAWIYAVLRILHSLWQATVNRVSVRFGLFLLSTIALIYLAYRAVALTLFANPGVIA